MASTSCETSRTCTIFRCANMVRTAKSVQIVRTRTLLTNSVRPCSSRRNCASITPRKVGARRVQSATTRTEKKSSCALVLAQSLGHRRHPDGGPLANKSSESHTCGCKLAPRQMTARSALEVCDHTLLPQWEHVVYRPPSLSKYSCHSAPLTIFC